MSGETMREAVARAIYAKLEVSVFLPYEEIAEAEPASRISEEDVSHEFLDSIAADVIRTVLERLREPSEAMLAAAVPEPVWLYEGRPKDYPDQMRVAVAIERAAAFQRWRTMVEAMEEELGLTMLDAAAREVGECWTS